MPNYFRRNGLQSFNALDQCPGMLSSHPCSVQHCELLRFWFHRLVGTVSGSFAAPQSQRSLAGPTSSHSRFTSPALWVGAVRGFATAAQLIQLRTERWDQRVTWPEERNMLTESDVKEWSQ